MSCRRTYGHVEGREVSGKAIFPEGVSVLRISASVLACL